MQGCNTYATAVPTKHPGAHRRRRLQAGAVAVEMANSNPASPLACLLDLTYRSAEAENDACVVSALKEKVNRSPPSAAACEERRAERASLY